ncbi:MAG TPA: class I tRNA ligase family protein, partial [Nitrospiria bacterium]|nr:class I tRNA ligase family protein [Nitrospiria bacterium]
AEFLPTGESPLKYHESFRRTTCPNCGREAERETDTLDTFVDSSWYQYRYLSPHYSAGPFDPAELQYWCPVDQYTGGAEHAVMHLLYTRFFTKALRDIGLVPFDEPMIRLFNQGVILGEDNEKMSKSRGNVVDPDERVAQYGVDAVRAYLMFMRPWEEGGPWSSRDIEGVARFIRRAWDLVTSSPACNASESRGIDELRRRTHQTIRKVTEDLERFGFNTAIAAMMEFVNILFKVRETPVFGSQAWQDSVRSLILMLAPIAPHVAEELWARMGGSYSVHTQPWPRYDPALLITEEITVVIQVNGKLRSQIIVAADLTEEEIKARALSDVKTQKWLNGRQPQKVIYVKGRLVNIVL